MQETKSANPQYHNYQAEGLNNNPLIAAMEPVPQSTKARIQRLARIPFYDVQELKLPSSIRFLLPGRLRSFNRPTADQVTLFPLVQAQIIDGYRHRNPLTRDGQEYIYRAGSNEFSLMQRPGYTPPQFSLIVAPPGVGKTTTMTSILSALGPTVIQHSTYKNKPFNEAQILYLFNNMPDRTTPKALSFDLCYHADQLMEKLDSQQTLEFKRATTRRDYLTTLRKAIASGNTGAIILDSFENISLAGTKGMPEVMALLNNSRDDLGVPIIFLGTFRAENALLSDPAIAQRICDGFHLRLHRPESPDDDEFRALVKIMGEFQWVQSPVDTSDKNVLETLYYCSQGITRVLLDIFIIAQMLAIDRGHKEIVSAETLLDTYMRHFTPIHPAMDALRSGDEEAIMKFEGLFPKAYMELSRTGQIGKVNQLLNSAREDPRANSNIAEDSPHGPTKKPVARATRPEDQVRAATVFPR